MTNGTALERRVLAPGDTPMPNDLLVLPSHNANSHETTFIDTTIIASVIFCETEEGHELYTLVLMAAEPSFFYLVEFNAMTQDITFVQAFENLVDAINGTKHPERDGFVDRGGDR